MAIIRDHIARVEQLGLDEAFLDLSDLHSPRSAMRRLVAEIFAQTGMRASVGIGPNRLVAKVASDAEKPNGFVVMTAQQARDRFADSPVTLVPGIGGKTSERLGLMGIETLGQLREVEPEALSIRFGPRQGPILASLAMFEGSADITTDRIAVSESRETTFDVDIASGPALEMELASLVTELSAALNKHDRRGRTIRIKVRLDDWTTITRSRTIDAATNDPATITDVALQLLRDYRPQRPVRLLGVGVAGFADAERQQQLELDLGEVAA